MQRSERRRIARTNLEDSYIKRILRRKKGLMAMDCTPKIIKETRESIKALRKKKKLAKKLLADGKYKCSRCFTIKPLNMFYKDGGKKNGHAYHCKECAPVSKSYKKASKKYSKRIRENLEDVYIKRALYTDGVKLEDVTSKMIISKRKSIQKHRQIEIDRINLKTKLLEEDKRICRICNKAKKNNTFIKKNHLINVCLDCYKPMMKASKENGKIWLKKYLIKNADRLRERRRLYRLNNPEIIKKCKEREKMKRREKSLNSINTCNDCNVELGLKKDTKGVRVCDDCEIIRKEINNEKNKERFKNYTEEQKLEIRKKQNKKTKKLREDLDDKYIINLLCSNSILKSKDIPQELVNAKREFLRFKRITKKEIQNENR